MSENLSDGSARTAAPRFASKALIGDHFGLPYSGIGPDGSRWGGSDHDRGFIEHHRVDGAAPIPGALCRRRPDPDRHPEPGRLRRRGGDRETAGEWDKPPVNYGASSTFPVPPEIEPNVDFWRHVYGIWSRNQVAIHDDVHMDVIYEVARLPGRARATRSPRRVLSVPASATTRTGCATWKRRVSTNQPLSAQDKELLAKFDRAGGTRALYGASERVRSQRGLRERFRRGMEISGRYEKSFRETMRANGLPEDLAYLPHVESSYQTNARSSAGAAGVWQFMPATGRIYMKVNGVVDDRYDPIVSANGAARYLSEAHNRLGSWPLAITSYNHGQGGMANAKAQYGHNFGKIVQNYQGKSFKFASRNYYAEFLAAREVAGHPGRYFPEGVNFESPWPHDRLVLRSSMPADHVARHYGVSTGSLASLNLHFREPARDGRAVLPTGTTVWLPSGSMQRVASLPPPYAGSTMLARNEPRSMDDSMTAAATSMAFRAVKAEPVLASLPPKAAPIADRYPRAEPKLAQVEPKSVKPEPRPAPVEERTAKPEAKTAKPEAKGAKPPSRGQDCQGRRQGRQGRGQDRQGRGQGAKPEAKTAKAEAQGCQDRAQDRQGRGQGCQGPSPRPRPPRPRRRKPAKSKLHVVKPQETLFRVASSNGLSVAELRKLNKMGPNDNSIRPGQKLKVGS